MANEISNQKINTPETLEQAKVALGRLDNEQKAQLGEELCIQFISLRENNPSLYQGIVDMLDTEKKNLEATETPENKTRLNSLQKLFALISPK